MDEAAGRRRKEAEEPAASEPARERRGGRRRREARRLERAERKRWAEREEATSAGLEEAPEALEPLPEQSLPEQSRSEQPLPEQPLPEESLVEEEPLPDTEAAGDQPAVALSGGAGRGERKGAREREREERAAPMPAGGERPGSRLVASPEDYVGAVWPPPGERRGLGRRLLGLLPFLLVVVLPTAVAAWYYGVVASDLYYTETRISVRSPGGSAAPPSLMSSALGGVQLGSASIEADSIAEFVSSHDAVRQLLERVDLRAIFTRPEGDFLTRLSGDASFEELVEHYNGRLEASYNEMSGIITLGVRSYRPEDSRAILEALSAIGERLVNAFNRRAEEDTLRLARAEVERAERRMAQARSDLLHFRLAHQELDPEQRSGSIQAIIAGLEREYAEVSAQLGEMRAYMEPGSLQIAALRNRLSGIEEQIRAEERRLTGGGEEGGAGEGRRYANVLNDYELLTLERELAHQEYVSAIASLEGARIEAQRQQVYLVSIVAPHDAEEALFPRRAENIGLVLLASLLIFLIGRLIVTGIQDHLMN